MKLIKASFKEIKQDLNEDLYGLYKMVEEAGRTCYKSEDRITEDSCVKFTERMIESKHLAMLEHATAYIYIEDFMNVISPDDLNILDYSPYTRLKFVDTNIYITTNLRVIIEHSMEYLLDHLVEPTENHYKRYTMKMVLSRGIANEFVRHRVFSFAQESTRYCNYSKKDKFDNTVTFIIPKNLDLMEGWYSYYMRFNNTTDEVIEEHCYFNGLKPIITDKDRSFSDIVEKPINVVFIRTLSHQEEGYFKLLKLGVLPQVARDVLGLGLKTELVMTGYADEWESFFNLRSPKKGAKGVHPDAALLADSIYEYFKLNKYLKINK